MLRKYLLLILTVFTVLSSNAQSAVDDEQLGAWYMYFFTKPFENSRFGIQGDYQFRYWDLGSDKEQLLLRTGLTYRPLQTDLMLTQGYAFISSGEFGESRENAIEHRIYQEVLMPQKVGGRLFFTHRFRFEQRWVENQDFRTRFRYNLLLNIPLNRTKLEKNALYLALYNEIFINGQKSIGEGRSVAYFDRNRTYLGLGYGLRNNLRLQTGWMNQTVDGFSKAQLQVSLHHSL
jgi:hypothetical protein